MALSMQVTVGLGTPEAMASVACGRIFAVYPLLTDRATRRDCLVAFAPPADDVTLKARMAPGLGSMPTRLASG